MRTIISLLPAFIILCCINSVHSQTLNWVNTYDGTIGASKPNDGVYLTATDGSFIYTYGTFQDSIDIDFGPGEHFIGSQGTTSGFLQKLNLNGGVIWTKILYSGPDYYLPINITSKNNKIVISGRSNIGFDADPDASVFNIPYKGTGNHNYFTVQFNINGDFEWCKNLNSTQLNSFRGHRVSNQGNVYLFGLVTNTLDIHTEGTAQNIITPSSNAVVYITKVDSDGDYVWSKTTNLNYTQYFYDADLDQSENFIISGFFQDAIDFDLSPNDQIVNNPGFHDYIVKYDSSGNLIFGRGIHGDPNNFPVTTSQVRLDNQSDILFLRPTMGSYNCEPDISNSNIVTSNGAMDGLVIKYSGINGDLDWVKQIGGSGTDIINRMSIDSHNNLTIGGTTKSPTVDLDPGQGTFNINTNGDSKESSCFVRLDSNGDFVIGGLLDDDDGKVLLNNILIDNQHRLIVGGTYENQSVDFDPTSGQTLKTANAAEDNWIAHYVICSNTSYSSIQVSECESYVSPSGKVFYSDQNFDDTITNHLGCDSIISIQLSILDSKYSFFDTLNCNPIVSPSGKNWGVSGTYFDTLVASNGCDSIMEFNVTIEPLNLNVINDSTNLIAEISDADYQWIDCLNNFELIQGANSRVFSPNNGGQYAVIISKNGCIDTSDCFLNTVGLFDQSLNQNLLIYPNPFSSKLHIESSIKGVYRIEIFDLTGKMVSSFSSNEKSIVIGENLSRGTYILYLISGNSTGQKPIKITKH